MLQGAFHPWAAEARLQAIGRYMLQRVLLRQVAAAWAVWLDHVQVCASPAAVLLVTYRALSTAMQLCPAPPLIGNGSQLIP